MSSRRVACEVLVIGGGPAGLAAADCAAQSGRQVVIVDDNPDLGGQIWRGAGGQPPSRAAARWLIQNRRRENMRIIHGARVFQQPRAGLLLAEDDDAVYQLSYEKLILAVGARERFLPFPGWTLPNVMGAGGLQALVKSGLPVAGKKVVVAGSGPLLLAVAAGLRERGADVLLIAEQASRDALLKFAVGLYRQPGKILQALRLKKQLIGVPYLTGCWAVEAHGADKLTGVTLRRNDRRWQVGCDYLACGFHLLPNLETAQLLGCEVHNAGVRVDDWQQTSVPDVYCAGEATVIGGLELSLAEGSIAGFAAANRRDEAARFFKTRAKLRSFADAMNRTFAPRDELKTLPTSDTIVCRCEDVTFGRVRDYDSWRAAKLHTRCGMGLCQGRVCGGAVQFLLNLPPNSVRAPLYPVKLRSLVHAEEEQRG